MCICKSELFVIYTHVEWHTDAVCWISSKSGVAEFVIQAVEVRKKKNASEGNRTRVGGFAVACANHSRTRTREAAPVRKPQECEQERGWDRAREARIVRIARRQKLGFRSSTAWMTNSVTPDFDEIQGTAST